MNGRIYQLLLVEDSKAEVRLFKEVLREWKLRHCLYVADDGEEALDMLQNHGNYDGAPTPDLIFLDLNMPKMDGLQVLACIRQHKDPAIRSIPVIMFTSSSSQQDVARAYDLGANVFITKPGDIDEFIRIMSGIEAFWFGVATVLAPTVPPICETNEPGLPPPPEKHQEEQ